MKSLNKYSFGLIFIIINILILSSCFNNNEPLNQTTIKVVEVESKPEKAKASSTDTEIKEFKTEKDIVYYNSYKINLEIDENTRNISGVERINFKNTTGGNLKNIYFHLYLNAFDRNAQVKPYFDQFETKIFKYGKDTGSIDIKSVHINNENINFEQDETILKINLSQELKSGETTEITLQFTSYIPKIAHRTGANDEAIWFGNFLPILCKYDDLGWRTDPYYPAGDPFYSDISNYEVRIATSKEYEVIGTGNESVIEVDNKKITTITAEMVRDFAFTISKSYKIKTITNQAGININFYYYSDDIYDIDKLLDTADTSLKYYSDKLGSYPYQELDIVEVELFLNNGGMEYPAFIMIDSGYLKKSSSINSIVHEIGHQWLYNIVGNDQINSAWLDEGLNSYLQNKFLYSDEELSKKINNDYTQLNSKIKSMYPKALNASLKEFNDWTSYYNIEYTRAELMLYSLNNKMGDELFDEFLKTYYRKYAFSTATATDFINTAEQIYNDSLSDFFKSWIYNANLPQLER